MPGARHLTETGIDAHEASDLLGPLVQFDHIVLAVSGGPDSVALMWLARDWVAREAGAPKLTVVTVDHGLREAAHAEAEQVAAWADAAGLPHHLLTCREIATESRVQEAARDARYEQLQRWCHANDAQAIVLAHTLDDQAETVIMRLARGSGVDGLAAMRMITMRDDIALCRPFLTVSKQRLIATLETLGRNWIDDPSNVDERFERVRVRAAMPSLAAIGLTPDMLAQTAERMARARDALDGSVDEAITRAVQVSPAGFCVINHHALTTLPDEIAMRILERCLIAVGGGRYAPRQARLVRLHGQFKDGVFTAATLGGCVIRRHDDGIVIVRETRRRTPSQLEVSSGQSVLWDGRIRVAVTHNGPESIIMRPLGAQGWKTLTETRTGLPKLPAFMRNALGSLWHDGSLIGICGLDGIFEPCGVKVEFVDRGLLNAAGRVDYV